MTFGLLSLVESLKSLTATISPFKFPFRRSENIRVANGIPQSISNSSPMRHESGNL